MDFDRVVCRELGKSYGRTRALSKFSLELPAGKVTALIGTNGAGKSTLLSILSTLSVPDTGELRYGELSHEEAARSARGSIGLVSHAALVYPQLSARENLHFFAALHGIKKVEERADAQLEAVGLIPAAWDRPAGTYSRGMLQRLALARALISDPKLLLLDEPFTGLDREASTRLVEIVKAARSAGKIILLVSHDLDLCAGLADRFAILSRGRLRHVCETTLDAPTLADLYRTHTAAIQRSAVGPPSLES